MGIYLETAMAVCDSCREIGCRLDSRAILSIAEGARSGLERSEKLKLALIADDIGSLNAFLQEAFHFPPVQTEKTIREAEITSPVVINYEKENNTCRAELAGFNEEGLLVQVSRAFRSEQLEQLDVKAYLKQGDFASFDWKRELPKADYVFLAVSAVHLLTAAEREFVEKQLFTYVGTGRFALILTDTDKLNSLQDLKEAESRLAGYLDMLEQKIHWHGLDGGTLEPFVTEKILGQRVWLRELTYEQISTRCCREVEEELFRMRRQLGMDKEGLKRQIELLKGREQEMRRKGRILASSIHNTFSGTVAYDAISAANGFVEQIDEKICLRLREQRDLKAAAKQLPEAMEEAMEQLELELTRRMDNGAVLVTEQINAQMEKDAGEFFTGVPDWAIDVLLNRGDTKKPEPGSGLGEAVEEMVEQASDKKARTISKVLLATAFPVFIAGGMPWTAGTLAASWLVRNIKFRNVDIDGGELEKRVHEACRDLMSDIEERIKEVCEHQADSAKKQITEAYDRFIRKALDKLAGLASEAEEIGEKRDILNEVIENWLPAMKRQIKQ